MAALLLVMDVNDWTITDKPYDLRERLFSFACTVTRVSQFLHTRGPIGVALSTQLLKSGTSAGANYEEADDGSSPKDKLAKRRIVLRELKETSFRPSLTFGSWRLGSWGVSSIHPVERTSA